MVTKPIEDNEYKDVMTLIKSGFVYKDKKGVEVRFRPNNKLYLALTLEANIGLRIGDVLTLTSNNFRNGKLVIEEDKTNKLQNREVNSIIVELVKDYALEQGLRPNDSLFNRMSVRAVQKALKIVADYLGIENISTHSFRKNYAMSIYENNNNNIELLKEMLNHSSIAITERYIRVSQQSINKASKAVCNII